MTKQVQWMRKSATAYSVFTLVLIVLAFICVVLLIERNHLVRELNHANELNIKNQITIHNLSNEKQKAESDLHQSKTTIDGLNSLLTKQENK